jgi:hypothetical protein
MNNTRQEVLEAEKTECIKKLARLDIDIEVLKSTPPQTVIARKQLSEHSHQEITAREMLTEYTQNKAGMEKRLKVIEDLMK